MKVPVGSESSIFVAMCLPRPVAPNAALQQGRHSVGKCDLGAHISHLVFLLFPSIHILDTQVAYFFIYTPSWLNSII